jgi:hypothetical protein
MIGACSMFADAAGVLFWAAYVWIKQNLGLFYIPMNALGFCN